MSKLRSFLILTALSLFFASSEGFAQKNSQPPPTLLQPPVFADKKFHIAYIENNYLANTLSVKYGIWDTLSPLQIKTFDIMAAPNTVAPSILDTILDNRGIFHASYINSGQIIYRNSNGVIESVPLTAGASAVKIDINDANEPVVSVIDSQSRAIQLARYTESSGTWFISQTFNPAVGNLFNNGIDLVVNRRNGNYHIFYLTGRGVFGPPVDLRELVIDPNFSFISDNAVVSNLISYKYWFDFKDDSQNIVGVFTNGIYPNEYTYFVNSASNYSPLRVVRSHQQAEPAVESLAGLVHYVISRPDGTNNVNLYTSYNRGNSWSTSNNLGTGYKGYAVDFSPFSRRLAIGWIDSAPIDVIKVSYIDNLNQLGSAVTIATSSAPYIAFSNLRIQTE